MGPAMRHGHTQQAACFLLVQLHRAVRRERSGKQLSGDPDALLLSTLAVNSFKPSAYDILDARAQNCCITRNRGQHSDSRRTHCTVMPLTTLQLFSPTACQKLGKWCICSRASIMFSTACKL